MNRAKDRRRLFACLALMSACVSCMTLVVPDDSTMSPDMAAVERGRTLFTTPQTTATGGMAACADCHGTDGSGASAADTRNSDAGHLQDHAQGDFPMPVKFPDLTAEAFADMAAYMLSECQNADDCTPTADTDHDHAGDHDETDATMDDADADDAADHDADHDGEMTPP